MKRAYIGHKDEIDPVESDFFDNLFVDVLPIDSSIGRLLGVTRNIPFVVRYDDHSSSFDIDSLAVTDNTDTNHECLDEIDNMIRYCIAESNGYTDDDISVEITKDYGITDGNLHLHVELYSNW